MKKKKKSALLKRLLLSLMGVITVFSFLPTFTNDFVTWDDDNYIKQNPYIELKTENIKSMFSQYYMRHYHPLTMLSLSIDNEIAGENPLTYHTTSLIFHLANTFLVFGIILLLFQRFDLAIMTGIMFGVHPLHVESVAWISERKDVLFAFFYLASLLTYIKFIKNKNWKIYIISILLFLFSLLSKAQALTLVLILPLIDLALNSTQEFKKNITNKIPYLILALIFGYIAIQADTEVNSVTDMELLTFFQKLILSAWAMALYIVKSFVPTTLLPLYTYPTEPRTIFYIVFYTLPPALLAILYLCRKQKIIIGSILFFVINLALFLPALSPVRNTIIADRYMYLPVIGTILITCYIFLQTTKKYPKTKPYVLSIFAIYTGFFAYQNFQQTKIWANGITLWTPVIKSSPQDYIPWLNRANAKYAINDFQGSISDYDETIQLVPNLTLAHYNRANALLNLNKPDQAIQSLNRVLNLEPQNPKALLLRGRMSSRIYKNYPAAEQDLKQLTKLIPNHSVAIQEMSFVLVEQQKYNEACPYIKQAISMGSTSHSTIYQEHCNK